MSFLVYLLRRVKELDLLGDAFLIVNTVFALAGGLVFFFLLYTSPQTREGNSTFIVHAASERFIVDAPAVLDVRETEFLELFNDNTSVKVPAVQEQGRWVLHTSLSPGTWYMKTIDLPKIRATVTFPGGRGTVTIKPLPGSTFYLGLASLMMAGGLWIFVFLVSCLIMMFLPLPASRKETER